MGLSQHWTKYHMSNNQLLESEALDRSVNKGEARMLQLCSSSCFCCSAVCVVVVVVCVGMCVVVVVVYCCHVAVVVCSCCCH